MNEPGPGAGRDRLDKVSAWTLVALGGLLLVSGLLSLGRATASGDWTAVALTAVLMLVIAAGVARGVRQLARVRRRSLPPDEPPAPTAQE